MKLNYKRTFLVGLAFMSICAFWQMYNNVIPLILNNTFHMNKTLSGTLMALDNVLALFLLPLFGKISDRSRNRLGRRMPFIIVGTVSAVVLMMFLPVLDNSYYESPAEYKIILFTVVLMMLLVAMGLYRSPAVALMPDVTPKPLRSQANAVINMMGAIGGIIYLIITSFLYSSARVGGLDHVDYVPLFSIVAVIMLVCVGVLVMTINEPKLAAENMAYEKAHPEQDVASSGGSSTKLPKDVRKSLIFILLSIFFWFFGYNAVTTWFTTYAEAVWDMALGEASMCLTVGSVGAIVAYFPIGFLAAKIGRKKSIMGGVGLLTACFLFAYIYTLSGGGFSPILYVLFVLVGVAWAAINVNSLPMVVEMCHSSDVGKFTGYYYTFSMAAQSLTPIVSGAIMERLGYRPLFLYAAAAVFISFLTMIMVRHGDNKPPAPSPAKNAA
ncbi:MAG: MFS transporter [Oscillospiraceae bacterium]|jgi:maltose/moltooligosaccharide transporter